LADEICGQVAACILEQSQREWTTEDSRRGYKEEKYWPKTVAKDAEWREEMVIDTRIRPKLLWRRPEQVDEIPDYRESWAPESPLIVDELRPNEEELARDQALKDQSSFNLFGGPSPFGRR
jgi:hypothetical protein